MMDSETGKLTHGIDPQKYVDKLKASDLAEYDYVAVAQDNFQTYTEEQLSKKYGR